MISAPVTIIGGGLVGSLMANLLCQNGIACIVCDAGARQHVWDTPYDLRVSAINRASKRLFTDVGAWPLMAESGVSPYYHMKVWDAVSKGQIEFDAAEMGEPQLGHIIENRVMQHALYQTLMPYLDEGACQYFEQDACESITREGDEWQLSLQSGLKIKTSLILGADGARSWVRQALNISTQKMFYGQHAVVAVVKTEQPHQKTAYQRFLPTGPLAFLPLQDPHHVSIVWSTEPHEAKMLTECDESAFNDQLHAAIGGQLGQVAVASKRVAFPLYAHHAETYVRPGVALLGDAAHTIHPLAGQGVNLGFADAKQLLQTLLWAESKSRPLSSLQTLRRYETGRKGHNQLALWAMQGFKGLFSNDSNTLSTLRGEGLSVVNRSQVFKAAIQKISSSDFSF